MLCLLPRYCFFRDVCLLSSFNFMLFHSSSRSEVYHEQWIRRLLGGWFCLSFSCACALQKKKKNETKLTENMLQIALSIACWLECRTRDRKVASSNPGRSGGRIFFSRVNFVCWLLFGVRSTPVLPQWHVKDPCHSAKSAGRRLHLNTYTSLTQQVGVGWLCHCPGIVWESIRKRAHTQLIREHSVTVVSTCWATVD